MPTTKVGLWVACAASLITAACGGDGLSTAEMEQLADERVRERLGLTPDAELVTDTFVGEPVDGDTVLCGTVQGRRADGTPIAPHRFIVAVDPARWLMFQPVDGNVLPSQPDKFVEWHTTCKGELAVD